MTPRQEEARRLALSGLLNTEIAAQMGISRQGVHNLLKATGTPSNRHPHVDSVEVTNLYQSGLTDKEIARVTGFSEGIVTTARRNAGIKGRRRSPLLKPLEIERLIRLAREGWLQNDIAIEFGIKRTTVSKYLIKHGLRRVTKRTTKQ